MTVQRRADPKKKFESVTEAVAVVAIEAIGAVVDRKLGTKSDIQTIAMRQIADITDR